jgi:hypothetical protein
VALTPQQLTALKVDIAAHPTYGTLPHTGDNAYTIAAGYNQLAVPDFWVLRTALTEKEIYEGTAPDGTTWSWATYKAQSVQDRDAWTRMMAPGVVNPSLEQTRAGWQAIFGGQGASLVQVNFLLALSRERASTAEKLLIVPASGAGTSASPAVMGFQGSLTGSDVEQAWAIP